MNSRRASQKHSNVESRTFLSDLLSFEVPSSQDGRREEAARLGRAASSRVWRASPANRQPRCRQISAGHLQASNPPGLLHDVSCRAPCMHAMLQRFRIGVDNTIAASGLLSALRSSFSINGFSALASSVSIILPHSRRVSRRLKRGRIPHCLDNMAPGLCDCHDPDHGPLHQSHRWSP